MAQSDGPDEGTYRLTRLPNDMGQKWYRGEQFVAVDPEFRYVLDSQSPYTLNAALIRFSNINRRQLSRLPIGRCIENVK